MKALSLHQPYASLVAAGLKTIETRPRRTSHRGPLLIVSTLQLDAEAWKALRFTRFRELNDFVEKLGLPYATALPLGRALAVVDVLDCRPLLPEDEPAAWFYAPQRYAWTLGPPRRVKELRVRGMQGLYPFDEKLLTYLDAR